MATCRTSFVTQPQPRLDYYTTSLQMSPIWDQPRARPLTHGAVVTFINGTKYHRRTYRSQHYNRLPSFLILLLIVGLTPAMFVRETGVELDPLQFRILDELDSPPDPDAGLYIRTRSGRIIKVAIPKNCLAFQTGEGIGFSTLLIAKLSKLQRRGN